MHKFLKQALEVATGESKHVVTIVADVRGFSKFSQTQDSADVATYVSKIYLKLVSEFSTISDELFFKTTGDGLLITIPFLEDSLPSVFDKCVETCIKCHDDFPDLLGDVPIINFPTPDKIGFGITRGSACALVAEVAGEKYFLDFSGHKLNLAARLQDLSRPSGVIFEGSSDLAFLGESIQNRFSTNEVFVKSVAEKEPIEISLLDSVILPETAFNLIGVRWEKKTVEHTKTQFGKLGSRYALTLKNGKLIEDSMKVRIRRKSNPAYSELGGTIKSRSLKPGHDFVSENAGKKTKVVLLTEAIKKNNRIFFNKAMQRDKIKFEINYELE